MNIPVEALLGRKCWVFLWEEVGRGLWRNNLVDECVCEERRCNLVDVKWESRKTSQLCERSDGFRQPGNAWYWIMHFLCLVLSIPTNLCIFRVPSSVIQIVYCLLKNQRDSTRKGEDEEEREDIGGAPLSRRGQQSLDSRDGSGGAPNVLLGRNALRRGSSAELLQGSISGHWLARVCLAETAATLMARLSAPKSPR